MKDFDTYLPPGVWEQEMFPCDYCGKSHNAPHICLNHQVYVVQKQQIADLQDQVSILDARLNRLEQRHV